MLEYEVSLSRVEDHGKQLKTFVFERPAGYDFIAGQYAILKVADNLMKPLTFSSSPTEGGVLKFTTRVSDSPYKKRLDALALGEKARISGPIGKFTLQPGVKKVLFLAGGIGITPFKSMSKAALDLGLGIDIALLWGVNSLDDAVFAGEFDWMGAENRGFSFTAIVASPPEEWGGWAGFISKETIEAEVPDYPERIIYICGPPKMVEAMSAALADMGLPKDNVIVEQFGGY